jgi:hypothetical protein
MVPGSNVSPKTDYPEFTLAFLGPGSREWHSSFGIQTGYELDGRRSIPGKEQTFLYTLVDPVS